MIINRFSKFTDTLFIIYSTYDISLLNDFYNIKKLYLNPRILVNMLYFNSMCVASLFQ
ncbi:MAG: hypothetical protein K0R54_4609 [Clostridiaceae bacterium]|jgi:hypothetical protein|nr:hypothetical protein [Clostridiaceae bacterium]